MPSLMEKIAYEKKRLFERWFIDFFVIIDRCCCSCFNGEFNDVSETDFVFFYFFEDIFGYFSYGLS